MLGQEGNHKQQKAQHDADQDAGGEWKIEAEVLPLDYDIAGQTAEPAEDIPKTSPRAQQEQHAYPREQQADDNQTLPETVPHRVVDPGIMQSAAPRSVPH